MATPPRVPDTQLSATLHRIANRREKVQDNDLERLPDPEQAHPVEMLSFLQRYQRVPRWVAQADVADALILAAWLWWEQRRVERTWLSRGRRLGLFLSQLGAPLGVGKRGVLDRLDRHEALLRFDRPDEKVTRASRRAAAEAEARRAVEQTWIEQHAAELTTLAQAVASQADRYELADEDREWVDELARDARDGAWTPASMTVLGMATDELQSAPEILALEGPRPHTVHQVLERATALRSEFAALTG